MAPHSPWGKVQAASTTLIAFGGNIYNYFSQFYFQVTFPSHFMLHSKIFVFSKNKNKTKMCYFISLLVYILALSFEMSSTHTHPFGKSFLFQRPAELAQASVPFENLLQFILFLCTTSFLCAFHCTSPDGW